MTQINQLVAAQVSQARAQVDQVVSQTSEIVSAAVPTTVPFPTHIAPTVLPPVVSLPPLARALGDGVAVPGLAVAVPGLGTTRGDAGITAPLLQGALSLTISPAPVLTPIPPNDPAAARPSLPRVPTPRTTTADLPTAVGPRARRPGSTAGTSAADPATVPPAWIAGAADRVEPAYADTAAPTQRAPAVDAAPHRHAPLPVRDTPAPAPISSVSAAAVGGGGSSGTGLPFLLALPFVAALLDLARRVALQRGTWPSGHRRRAPERPG